MPRRSKSTSWWGGLACGAVLAVSPATVLLLGVLLAPALLVRVVDGPDRQCMRAVMLCNIAAVITPLCTLWRTMPPVLSGAIGLLSEPTAIPTAWLAAGAAWLASELLCVAAYRSMDLRDRRQAARLEAEIAQLSMEWGAPEENKATS